MKKIIMLIFITLLLTQPVLAKLCEENLKVGTTCQLVTPPLDCNTSTTFNTDTGLQVINETMNILNANSSIYNFTFIQGEGNYVVELCDNHTVWLISVEDEDSVLIYLIILGAVLVFLIIGQLTDEFIFPMIAGFLLNVMALNMFLTDFPNLTNVFLKNSFVIIIAGLGFYFILVPIINWHEKTW